MATGLGDAARLARSRALLARTVAGVDGCAPGVASSTERVARDSALVEIGGPAPRGDPAAGAERALTLASTIWRGRPPTCLPDSSASSDVIVLLQRSLSL